MYGIVFGIGEVVNSFLYFLSFFVSHSPLSFFVNCCFTAFL